MSYLCQLSGVPRAGTWWRLIIIFLPLLQKNTSFVLRSCNEILFTHRRSQQGQHVPLNTSLHEEISPTCLKSQIKKSVSFILQPQCPYTDVCTCECIYESIHTHICTLRPNVIIWAGTLTTVSTCLF